MYVQTVHSMPYIVIVYWCMVLIDEVHMSRPSNISDAVRSMSSGCSQLSCISDDESSLETSVVDGEPASYKAYTFGKQIVLNKIEHVKNITNRWGLWQ